MRGFEPMTLANMRLNGVRSVIASCANCGRSADVNVDLLPETLTVPETGKRLRCSSCGGKTISTRPAWHTGSQRPGMFLTIGENGRRCPDGRRLHPNAWRSAPALKPGKGEQDKRYDERTDRVLDGDVIGARLEPREKRRKATRWNKPVHGGGGKEQDAKKSGDQRQGAVH